MRHLALVTVAAVLPLVAAADQADLFELLEGETKANAGACSDDLFARLDGTCGATKQQTRPGRPEPAPAGRGQPAAPRPAKWQDTPRTPAKALPGVVDLGVVPRGSPVIVDGIQSKRASAWLTPVPRPPDGRRVRGSIAAFHVFEHGSSRMVIAATAAPGRYTLRLAGVADRVFTIGPSDARIAVPEQLAPCAKMLWVRFKGPRLDGDTISIKDRSGAFNIAQQSISAGSPASISLDAPKEAGDYRVVYSSNSLELADARFAVPEANCPVKSERRPTVLSVNALPPSDQLRPRVARHRLPAAPQNTAPFLAVDGVEVLPCAPIGVRWAGKGSQIAPAAAFSPPEHFVSLAATVQPASSFLDAVPALAGRKDEVLFAPQRPGRFEVRLVKTGQDNIIRALVPVTVVRGDISACDSREAAIEERTEALGQWIETVGERLPE